jgi:hypothetical protein
MIVPMAADHAWARRHVGAVDHDKHAGQPHSAVAATGVGGMKPLDLAVTKDNALALRAAPWCPGPGMCEAPHRSQHAP